MANTVSLRATLAVQFNLDTTPATTPITLLANRQFDVVDWSVLSQAADLDLQIQALDTATPPVATVIGRIVNGATTTWFRPSQSGNAANDGYLAANAVVIRGGSLRLTAEDLDSCQGTVTILPGNRYGATTNAAYYANNSAATRFA
jgi:hypothetical protein